MTGNTSIPKISVFHILHDVLKLFHYKLQSVHHLLSNDKAKRYEFSNFSLWKIQYNPQWFLNILGRRGLIFSLRRAINTHKENSYIHYLTCVTNPYWPYIRYKSVGRKVLSYMYILVIWKLGGSSPNVTSWDSMQLGVRNLCTALYKLETPWWFCMCSTSHFQWAKTLIISTVTANWSLFGEGSYHERLHFGCDVRKFPVLHEPPCVKEILF